MSWDWQILTSKRAWQSCRWLYVALLFSTTAFSSLPQSLNQSLVLIYFSLKNWFRSLIRRVAEYSRICRAARLIIMNFILYVTIHVVLKVLIYNKLPEYNITRNGPSWMQTYFHVKAFLPRSQIKHKLMTYDSGKWDPTISGRPAFLRLRFAHCGLSNLNIFFLQASNWAAVHKPSISRWNHRM